MATENVKYRFIQNVGDYFPSGYFGEDFINKVQKASGLSADEIAQLNTPFVALRQEYDKYKNYIINTNPRVKDAIKHTHDFNTMLLRVLGYDVSKAYDQFYAVSSGDDGVVPVRHVLTHNGKTRMLVMEMQHLIKTGEEEPAGLFTQQYDVEHHGETTTQLVRHQRYSASQWSDVFSLPADTKISPAVINKAIDALFLLPTERRPHFILMLAGNEVFLLDSEKWHRGAYLEFSLDELFSQASIKVFRNYYALFHLLTSKETLAADSETVLMDTLAEESYKNAYEVTKDLKDGVVLAVETLANEALYYKQHVVHEPFGKVVMAEDGTRTYDATDDAFEAEVKDDCLNLVYRLLFLFYAESRPELGILPVNDEIYQKGYSVEMLRDMEQINFTSAESKNGYFFDDSIKQLFRMLACGQNIKQDMGHVKGFCIKPIDSPMFDDHKLHHLADVRIRNGEWQKIICALSLSKKNRSYGRGRISYANLGVNQLGSVYESLLAYRGFYAEEDYIEVHKANEPSDGTFLVPYSRMDAFADNEILKDEEGNIQILKKNTFVYRLNGRDRQKSASYYTPEVLTRSTVKYTLKSIIDEVAAGKRKATELLDLKILEPAMGAAAFQNEVINQLAEAYLTYQQQQRRESGIEKWHISPDKYLDELQKVKAYIATHNVYGVDLNPTAIELGKLSLWLNVIHKDMETPFFSNRLALGNAVIGAWLKVYSKEEFYATKGTRGKLIATEWWEKAPHKVKFNQNSVRRSVNEVYHFLLPDKNMLAVRSIDPKEHKAEVSAMKNRIADWTAPIGDSEFRTLQRLSGKIDVLLKQYFQFQQSVEGLTNNKMNLWGVPGAPVLNLDSYEEKERLNDLRYGHDNAYFRLKMVLDYWCALWFWEYDDTVKLPNRAEYWSDIEAMLDVSDADLDSRTARALNKVTVDRNGQLSIAMPGDTSDLFAAQALRDQMEKDSSVYHEAERESEIIRLSKTELLAQTKGKQRTFFDDSERFAVVKRLADRYHFFHPMLEFIEVFWLRDGFDIICGNPPWLKYTFKDEDVLQEKYPEVVLHKKKANIPTKEEMFADSSSMLDIYNSERVETTCSGAFMNACSNYPLLIGQQTNLYKCILENALSLLSDNGLMGLVHPETIYDEPNGQPLRNTIYKHLKYHFRFRNSLLLFAEVRDQKQYSINVYTGESREPNFDCIFNLYHPSTIDSCFASDGAGKCPGIKVERPDGTLTWNLRGHKKRIIHFDKKALLTLARVFEDNDLWFSAKLGAIYVVDVISVLEKLAFNNRAVKNHDVFITQGFDSTNAITDGTLNFEIQNTNVDNYEMVYSGPNIYVGTAFYKSPRLGGYKKSDFDIVDLTKIDEDFILRTRYVPQISIDSLKNTFQSFAVAESWQDYYKVGYRKMLNQTGDRTLNCGILIKKSSHVNGVISAVFKDEKNVVELAGLSSSLLMDFLMKTIASANLTDSRLKEFPLGVDEKFINALYSRTLLLNCLTKDYAELWEKHYKKDYNLENWSIKDNRLKPFDKLAESWSKNIPLRNDFERRMALVEIDVIVAMAMGLELDELITIYESQFDVLLKNEQQTYYDQTGRVIFTKNAGLLGVGVETSTWNNICGVTHDDGNTFEGINPTYIHVVDSQKSTIYGGDKIQYIAPYNRCDRIEDYRRAWAHFEELFNS